MLILLLQTVLYAKRKPLMNTKKIIKLAKIVHKS